MPLSTKYIMLINDALDTIPIDEMMDFEIAAAELKKMVSGSEAIIVFAPRFKEAMESIHEFFDPTYAYVKPDEQVEFCELLKKQIRIKIEKLRSLTEEQKQEKIIERKNEAIRRSENQKKMAAFEPKRAEHKRLAEKEFQEFMVGQQVAFEAFSIIQTARLLRRLDDVSNASQLFPIIAQQQIQPALQQTPREIINLATNFFTDIIIFGRGLFTATPVIDEERRQQAESNILKFVFVAISAFRFLAFGDVLYASISLLLNPTSTNTTEIAERFREPYSSPVQLFSFMLAMMLWAALNPHATRHQINDMQNFLAATRGTIYGMWNQVRGNKNQVQQDVEQLTHH